MCLPSELKGRTIQRIVTALGGLLCLNFGVMFGITPAHMALYQLDDTPLNRPISADDATLVASLLFLSAAFGALLLGSMSQKIGPKSTLMLSGLLQIVFAFTGSWSSIHFAYDIWHIYASRIFGGFAAGATFTVLPLYIMEIAEESTNGALMASIEQWRTLGILAGFAMGYYLQYEWVSLVAMCLSFAFTMLFPFSQESPHYFMRNGNVHSMEKSLRWYRGIRRLSDRNNPDFLRELEDFKSKLLRHQMRSQWGVCGVSGGYLVRLCTCAVVLVVGAQCSGVYIILTRANEILAVERFGVFAQEVDVLILAVMQFVGASVVVWMWPNFKRKLLLSCTALAAGLCLTLLACYLANVQQLQFHSAYCSWIPFGILALYMLLVNLGMFPLATLAIGEIFSPQQRVAFSTAAWTLSWFLLFVCIQYFQTVTTAIGLAGCFGIFAACCIGVGIFGILLLPETYGKSVIEVQHSLGYLQGADLAKSAAATTGQFTQRPTQP